MLPAHGSLISTVRFEPEHGRTLLTASYDHSVKARRDLLWSCAPPSAMFCHSRDSLCTVMRGTEPWPAGLLLQVWGAHNFRLLRSLVGHDARVMGADYAAGGALPFALLLCHLAQATVGCRRLSPI